MGTTPTLAAALVGIPAGIQKHGTWAGRRQLYIRFAGPAETAQMYAADALARELTRALSRTPFHSVCISGRDALANEQYLSAVLKQLPTGTRVMADTDGQRPGAIAALAEWLELVQVTVDLPSPVTTIEHAMATLKAAAAAGKAHTLVVSGTDEASDADYLQVVEQAHAASVTVSIVLYPGPTAEHAPLDRRWGTLMEHALARHRDVQLSVRLSGPSTIP
jgi:organic radical activating enzyme